MVKKIIKRLILGKSYGFLQELPIGIIIINKIFQFCGINKSCKIPVHFTSVVSAFENIEIHFDKSTLTSFSVSGQCYIQAINGIKIGKNFLFAPGIKLISANHDLSNHNQWLTTDPIVIGNNVWIGTNAVILPGVQIADDCVIGAGAVVTKSFQDRGSIVYWYSGFLLFS